MPEIGSLRPHKVAINVTVMVDKVMTAAVIDTRLTQLTWLLVETAPSA